MKKAFIYIGHTKMSAFIKLASVLALFISPVVVAIAGEQSHCTKINEYPFIITQCDDGTVTVVNVINNRVAVCRKGESCKEIKL
ncbi:hypothetical protein [Escherichia coli]|nr:hypothetical protein [Escherichia coli]